MSHFTFSHFRELDSESAEDAKDDMCCATNMK